MCSRNCALPAPIRVSSPLRGSKGSPPNSLGRIQRTPAVAAAVMRLCWVSGGAEMFRMMMRTSWPLRACTRESLLL